MGKNDIQDDETFVKLGDAADALIAKLASSCELTPTGLLALRYALIDLTDMLPDCDRTDAIKHLIVESFSLAPGDRSPLQQYAVDVFTQGSLDDEVQS